MSKFPVVDVHMHVYQTAEEGIADKAAYELWEYGNRTPEVALIDAPGTVDDVVAALDDAGAMKGVVANVFSSAGLRESGVVNNRELVEKYIESNQKFCELLKPYNQLIPFISVDPIMHELEDQHLYIQNMIENFGVGGVKIHPNLQSVYLHDPRMLPVWKSCTEFGLPVLTHSGACRGSHQYSEPNSFTDVLSAFPDLKLIVAHLGGAAWKQTSEFSKGYPKIAFDLCEHIIWAGAENAANDKELAQLILDVGPERVMMGSDFPWYSVVQYIERVMELPLLAVEQKERILGSNAIDFLKL